MKKFTLILIAALLSSMTFAQKRLLQDIGSAKTYQQQLMQPTEKQVEKLVNVKSQNTKHKALTRKVSHRANTTDELVGNFVAINSLFDYDETEGLVSSIIPENGIATTITKIDESTIGILGLVDGATEAIEATVDLTEGTLTIADGQTLHTTSYGPVILKNVQTEGDITAKIYDDGIVFDQIWTDIIGGDGDYAGYLYSGYYYSSALLAANGEMSWQNAGNYGNGPADVFIYQDEEAHTTTVYNFAGNGVVLSIDMKENNQFSIASQLVFEGNSTTGNYYFYGIADNKLQSAVSGTGTNTELTLGSDWTYYSEEGYWYNLFSETTIELTDGSEFIYPSIPDVAAMPAAPSILNVGAYDASSGYGYVIFDVPTKDINDNDIKESKLSYQLFSDTEHVIEPIVFSTDLYVNLTEDISIIPYTFTDSYDFNNNNGYKVIYLNYDYPYNRIGIKSIYTGGGETNETEIQWYTIKAYAIDVARDALLAEIAAAEKMMTDDMTQGVAEFTDAIAAAQAVADNANATIADLNAAVQDLKAAEQDFVKANSDPSSVKAIWIASEQGYENAEDIDEFVIDDNIKATLLQNDGTTHPKYYTSGTALRLYAGNTLTISGGENVEKITKIMITYSGASYASNIETDVETYTLNGKIGVWEGEATEVTFTRTGTSGHARIQNIAVEYNVVGSEPAELVAYTYTFGQALNGWSTIDADGDGYTWQVIVENSLLGHNGKPGLVTSESYNNSEKIALTPDNYLVSPKMKLDGKITFWACAQDASYAAEHFCVAVSTASATDATDFQTVSEEFVMKQIRHRAQGNWYEYAVDLSSFAGQEGYVAIRHFNCTDMFRLNVDEITLETSQLIDAYDENLEVEPEAPVEPEVVVLPEGVEVEEYSMIYFATATAESTTSKPINVAVDGNDVYFQGLSQYLPEAWVKGTKDGNTVTFASNQYMGEYGTYGSSYFFYAGDAVFTYDAEDESYSADGQIFGVLADQYYDGNYFDPVLQKVTEVAAIPATPLIAGIEETNYGDVIVFNIPTTDVDGNGMITSKLFYQFFIDDEDTPLTFTTQYFSKLTENMTVIPYGFTEDYDFFSEYIYLNMPHDTWQKVGIQSIYTGGGVENKSEIFWFEMPVKEQPVEAPVDLATETYSFNANAIEYGKEAEGAKPYNIQVLVGFDGDDLYIQGLSADAPELWVKGTKNEAGQYVVPANQYMGDLSFWGYTFPYYWTAFDADSTCVDAVFDFDAETSTITSTQTMALNGSAETLDYYLTFTDIVISKLNDVAATPADPIFESINFDDEYPSIYLSIPTVDIEGNSLLVDKLFYTIWIEKNGEEQPYTFTATLYGEDFEEDVVEIPYSHDNYDIYKGGEIVYFEENVDELNSWTKVGVQSIYYGGEERNTSNIVWLQNPATTGISSINADNSNARYFDLQGRTAQKAQKGLLIKQVRDAEGNVTTVKVVRK